MTTLSARRVSTNLKEPVSTMGAPVTTLPMITELPSCSSPADTSGTAATDPEISVPPTRT